MSRNILRTTDETIEVITLNRPPVNALELELTEELTETFLQIARDRSAEAVVLTANGTTFCAGLDLRLVPAYSKSEQNRLLEALNRMVLAVYACPLPVVAAINGHAIAGGLVLALCCDWRMVANAPVRTALAEVRVAVPYPAAALEVVRSELTPQNRRRLVLLGETISKEDAMQSGIFDESFPPHELLQAAKARAARYARLPPRAFEKIKNQVRASSIAAMRSAILDGGEPLTSEWLSDETKLFASRRIV